MSRTRCEGIGKKAVPADVYELYPACPDCGREFSAQGRKAQRRYAGAWRSIPLHYVER